MIIDGPGHGDSGPALFIASRFDSMYPTETLREAASSSPHGQFKFLDTSHISVVDESENTIRMIYKFIAKLCRKKHMTNFKAARTFLASYEKHMPSSCKCHLEFQKLRFPNHF